METSRGGMTCNGMKNGLERKKKTSNQIIMVYTGSLRMGETMLLCLANLSNFFPFLFWLQLNITQGLLRDVFLYLLAKLLATKNTKLYYGSVDGQQCLVKC